MFGFADGSGAHGDDAVPMRRSVGAPKMVEQHRTVIHMRLDSESVAVEDEAGDRNVDRGCRMSKGVEDVLRDGPMVTRLLVIWLTLGLRQIVGCDGVQNGWFHGLVPNTWWFGTLNTHIAAKSERGCRPAGDRPHSVRVQTAERCVEIDYVIGL